MTITLAKTVAPVSDSLPNRIRLALVMPGLLAHGFIIPAVAPALPQMARYFGDDVHGQFIASMIITAAALGMAAGGWLSGWLLERMGFRTFFVVALTLMAVSGSAPAILDNSSELIAARVLAGVAVSCLTTSCLALIPYLYSEADRPKIVGFQQAFGSGAAIACTLVAGMLVAHGGWRAPFWLFGPVFLAPLLLVGYLPTGVLGASRASTTKIWAELKSAMMFWPIYPLAMTVYALFAVVSTQIPYLLRIDGVVSPLATSGVISLSALIFCITCFGYGAAARRVGPYRLLQAAGTIVATALFGIGLLRSAPAAVAAAGLIGLAGGLAVSSVYDLAMRYSLIVGPAIIGIVVTAFSIGTFINPMLFGSLTSVAGLPGAMVIVAIAVAVATLLTVVRHPSNSSTAKHPTQQRHGTHE
jgi:predicted MFS family arabinose efflux permease